MLRAADIYDSASAATQVISNGKSGTFYINKVIARAAMTSQWQQIYSAMRKVFEIQPRRDRRTVRSGWLSVAVLKHQDTHAFACPIQYW